jgi:phosphoribosyl 1,2-cyclic phosphodiesterase
VAFGGNTSCVEVRCGATRLILDGGTGLRELGRQLAAEGPLEAHLLFSHVHWDHIQGFPFFAPAFEPDSRLHLYGCRAVYGGIEEAMRAQMSEPNFPVSLDELPCALHFHDFEPGRELALGSEQHVRVRARAGSHPGGVLLFRVEYGGKALVYATDTEHPAEGMDTGLVELARKADVLIYDAQYTPQEYAGQRGASKVGWGHSTFEHGARIAQQARVGRYVLFHHDPEQDDAAVRDKEQRAQGVFPDALAAHEGLVLEL